MALIRKHVDIMWSGTTKDLEDRLRPIRIPLFGGLLGYRIAIVDKYNKHHFAKYGLEQLKQLRMCQGETWGDSDIFEENGFNVVRVILWEQMINMLAKGRCDMFPRAIHEAYFEVNNERGRLPNIEVMDDIIFHYDFPAYIFVRKEDEQLAQDIRIGFMQVIESDEYRTLLKHNALTKHIFPLSKWNQKTAYQLKNSALPEATPLSNKRLWLNLFEESH